LLVLAWVTLHTAVQAVGETRGNPSVGCMLLAEELPRLTIKSAAVYTGNYTAVVLEIVPLNGTVQISAIQIGDFYVECFFNNVISRGGVYVVKLPNASVEPGRVLTDRLILLGNISYPFAASAERGPAPEAKPLCED